MQILFAFIYFHSVAGDLVSVEILLQLSDEFSNFRRAVNSTELWDAAVRVDDYGSVAHDARGVTLRSKS